jgi:hypothetical protein
MIDLSPSHKLTVTVRQRHPEGTRGHRHGKRALGAPGGKVVYLEPEAAHAVGRRPTLARGLS